MKTTYRLLARRRLEAALPLRLKTPSRARIQDEDPAELSLEAVDLATSEIADRRRRQRRPLAGAEAR